MKNTKSLEVTSVLAVLENQLSYLDKMNPFTINFSLEVSSGLAFDAVKEKNLALAEFKI